MTFTAINTMEIIKSGPEQAEASQSQTTTPRRRGHKIVIKDEGDADGNDDTSPSKKAKTTKGSPKKAAVIPIPTSLEAAGPEDRMLLRMKEEEGCSWKEIAAAWESMAGNKVPTASLSTRYIRIKANLAVFPGEDEENLIRAKKEIEEKFEVEKWHKIAEAINSISGNKYSTTTLQKKFKEITKKGQVANSTSVKEQ